MFWFCCHEFSTTTLTTSIITPHTCSTSQNPLYHLPSRKKLHSKALGGYHNSVSCWWSITLRMVEQFNQRLKRNKYKYNTVYILLTSSKVTKHPHFFGSGEKQTTQTNKQKLQYKLKKHPKKSRWFQRRNPRRPSTYFSGPLSLCTNAAAKGW